MGSKEVIVFGAGPAGIASALVDGQLFTGLVLTGLASFSLKY